MPTASSSRWAPSVRRSGDGRLPQREGEKVGLLNVHLYRPFSIEHFFKFLPKTTEKVAVLDHTKEPGSLGEPLYLDVKAAFYHSDMHPTIVGGRFGLGGKDTTPDQIFAVFEELKKDSPKDGFTIGIDDDVTHTSLTPALTDVDLTPEGTTACKFWGLGSGRHGRRQQERHQDYRRQDGHVRPGVLRL